MAFPTVIDSYQINGVPPKSTNSLYFQLWKNFFVKTYSYQFFRDAMNERLTNDPKAKGFLPSKASEWSDKGLYIEVGIIEEFDLDNTLKGIIDSLQAHYGFNDNQIKGLIARKVPIGSFPLEEKDRHKQYIKIALLQYDNDECRVFDESDLTKVSRGETTVPDPIMKAMYRSITGDWSNQNSPTDNPTRVYPTIMYPDIEKAAKFMEIEPAGLVKLLRSTGGKFDYHVNLAFEFGKDEVKLLENLGKEYTKSDLEKDRNLFNAYPS
jgi:hypothetical protein